MANNRDMQKNMRLEVEDIIWDRIAVYEDINTGINAIKWMLLLHKSLSYECYTTFPHMALCPNVFIK